MTSEGTHVRSRPVGRRAMRRPGLSTIALLTAALVGCAGPLPVPHHVVVILVDTLRADRLGAWGNTRNLTPFLDAFAERAFVFHHAYAAAPHTMPSVASLFTSRFPSQHGLIETDGRLPASTVTLAGVLAAHGWATAGFLATPVVSRVFGFDRGFATWDELGRNAPGVLKRSGRELNRRLLAWLPDQDLGRSTFLYLHYMEPHLPYVPPAVLLEWLRDGAEPPSVERANDAMMIANGCAPDAATLRDILDVYDAEVAAVDGALRQLLDELERAGVLDQAVVVVTADHGEAFGEHGVFGHGTTLYEEMLHVPLLVRLPGQTARVDVDDPVSLVDVAPTLLDLAGIAAPPAFEGRSRRDVLAAAPLRRALARWAAAAPPVLAELVETPARARRLRPHARALLAGRRKLIVGPSGESVLYDLGTDPGETTPLAADGALRAALDAFATRIAAAPTPTEPTEIDAATHDRLRALGYAD